MPRCSSSTPSSSSSSINSTSGGSSCCIAVDKLPLIFVWEQHQLLYADSIFTSGACWVERRASEECVITDCAQIPHWKGLCSMSMYSFQHLINQTDKHDVIFYVEEDQQQLYSAGFMKVLLAGVSEMWRARDDGSWTERTDERGRILHEVEIPAELASDVLRSLQSVIFTGVLPGNLDCRVLCILAKLSDAEVMPHILDTAATELRQRVPEYTSPTEATMTVLWLDQHLCHIDSLQQWVADTCETLSRPFAEQAEARTTLLNQLSVNSMAAFGVVKAGWQHLMDKWPDRHHVAAIKRHRQVITENATLQFLQVDSFYIFKLKDIMHDISHRLFGSPESVLQSPESIQQFKTMLRENSKIGSFGDWYIDRPSREYLELLHHVLPASVNRWRFVSAFNIGHLTVARLLEDVNILKGLSAKEMETLVLPLLQHTTEASIRSLVQALYHSKQQAEAAQQPPQESDRHKKQKQVRQLLNWLGTRHVCGAGCKS